MPIKYGEVTIIHDKEQLSIFSNLLLWFKYEIYEPNISKCIYFFEDGEIYDKNDKLEDFKYNFKIALNLDLKFLEVDFFCRNN